MAALTYRLIPKCRNSITDIAGDWIIEGGELRDRANKRVGDYSLVARTSCGTKLQECAQLWMTLFFLSKPYPPENMTLHGAHGGGGQASGSVSAATGPFAARIGHPFNRAGDILTIA